MKAFFEKIWAPVSFILIIVLAVAVLYLAINQSEGRNALQRVPATAASGYEVKTSPSLSAPTDPPNNVYWIADLVERTLPVVVHVKTERKGEHPQIFKEFKQREDEDDTLKQFREYFPFFEFKFPPDFEFKMPDIPITGVGSGFIVKENGYIVTNAHVVQGADKITVVTYDGKEYPAKLVGKDPMKDIAVLKIDAKGLPTAVLGDSSKLRIGEPAIAIGSPFGLEATVTAGIISTVARDPRELELNVDPRRVKKLIQTDAAINRGNSGGPLLNAKGEVIGVNQAIIPYADRIGFAIPINEVKQSIQQIIEHGDVQYPAIGVWIQEINDETRKELDVEVDYGVYVRQVNVGGPGDKAGLEPGDVIMEINGIKVKTPDDLIAEIQKHDIGEKVTLLVAKQGKKNRKIKVIVVLGKLEATD